MEVLICGMPKLPFLVYEVLEVTEGPEGNTWADFLTSARLGGNSRVRVKSADTGLAYQRDGCMSGLWNHL